MPELQAFPVVTKSGRKGRVYRASRFLDRGDSQVRLDDGSEFTVPPGSLRVQPDGSFFLDDDGAGSETLQQTPARDRGENIPAERVPADAPAESGAPPDRRQTSAAAPVSVNINEPLFSEDVSVERVPVNRIIDAVPETREEGEVTIIPVIEEVITVEKRLLLREEVHIRRKRTELNQPRTVVVTERKHVVGADGRDVEV